MFQDDRIMSILSGIVLMVAIGTVVQKSDVLQEWFAGKGGQQPALVADDAEAEAGSLVLIDVLANDTGLDEEAGKGLTVTTAPRCGRVFVQQGVLQYLTDASCIGPQVMVYGLRESALAPAEVRIEVVAADQAVPLASAGEREVPAASEAGLTLAAGPADAAPEVPRPAAAPEQRDAAPAPAGISAGAPAGGRAPAVLGSADDAGNVPAAAAPQVGAPATPGEPGRLAGTSAAGAADGPGAAPAEDLRPAALAPQALSEPSTETRAAARLLPEAVRPSREIAGLADPAVAGGAGGHGVEGAAPSALAGRSAEPGAQPRAPEMTLADAGRRPPEAPRPAEAAAPETPGTPTADAGALAPAAAPAPIFRPTNASATLAEAPAPDAPSAPARRDSDPLEGDLLAGSNPPRTQVPGLATAELRDEAVALGSAESLGAAGRSGEDDPAALEGTPTLSFSLAQLDVPGASAEPAAATGAGGEPTPRESGIERPELPTIGTGEESRVALGEPESGLGPVRDLGAPLRLEPADRAEPPALDAPKAPGRLPASRGPEEAGAKPAAADPAATVGSAEPAAAEPAAADEELAALPPAAAACTAPPAATIAAGRAAITTVTVTAPCQAGTAAVLDYGGLSLGVPLDASGEGAVDVPGFASRMDATLTFKDGETLSMTLPFEEIQRIERVALVWNMPVDLELHALEFGGGRDAHVGPESDRGFRDVRRSGGGFLQAYAPVDGAGQHARVYTYYLRAGGPKGIVRMMVDFASRRAGEAGTCGDGDLASPGFTVLRSSRGMQERPIQSRLSALGCGSEAEAADEMIENAVGNLVIAD